MGKRGIKMENKKSENELKDWVSVIANLIENEINELEKEIEKKMEIDKIIQKISKSHKQPNSKGE